MIIETIYIIFLTLWAALLLHEAGHVLIWMGIFREPPKITIKNFEIAIGRDKDYKRLNSKQYLILLGFGVLLGILPLILSSLWISKYAAISVIPYIVGCWSDLKNIQAQNAYNVRLKRKNKTLLYKQKTKYINSRTKNTTK